MSSHYFGISGNWRCDSFKISDWLVESCENDVAQ